jgi:hypothetical protein
MRLPGQLYEGVRVRVTGQVVAAAAVAGLAGRDHVGVGLEIRVQAASIDSRLDRAPGHLEGQAGLTGPAGIAQVNVKGWRIGSLDWQHHDGARQD